MHNSGSMDGIQPCQHLGHDRAEFLQVGQRTVRDAVLQGFAFDELHDQIGLLIPFQIIKNRDQIAMDTFTGGLGFAGESLQSGGALGCVDQVGVQGSYGNNTINIWAMSL